MPAISSQSHLRRVRDLPFCHVCGKHFAVGDLTDHDHVPAQACFDKADRNPPLKLKAHVLCNNQHRLNDEKVGELLAVQRTGSIAVAHKLRVNLFQEGTTGRTVGAAHNLDLVGCIRRWVGGFHAALYREPLRPGTLFQINPPLPHAALRQRVNVEAVPASVREFVRALKLNRAARNLDCIATNNGKLRYECIWAQEDRGPNWLCVWALDLYGWVGLGDKRFGSRGCTGAYLLDTGQPPSQATRATRIVATVPNEEPLNAFGP